MYCSETCKVAFFDLTIKKLAEKRAKKNKSAIEWQKKANENWKKFKVEQKTENRSYQANIVLTKKDVQKWSSLRDVAMGINTCIACQKTFFKGERTNASHHFKAELYSGTIFNPHNLNISCVTCNQYNDGNLAEYTPNLIDKIGIEQFTHLKQLAFSNREFRYDVEWLKELRSKTNQWIKSNNFDNSNLFEMLKEIDLY